HRPDEAQRLLEKAGSEDQPDLEAIRLLDAHYTQRGEWDRLADVLERLARVSGDTAERSRSVARLAKLKAETLHDREGANGAYLALLELEPNHDEALRYCSDYLYDQRKLEEAVALFRRRESIENDRDLDDFDAQIEAGMFFYRFADALRLMGEKEEAIRRYERALDLNSTHLPTLEAVGPLYMAAAAWPKAEKVYRQLVQLTGGHGNSSELAHIYARLGTVEARLGQLDKARKRFSKALEIHPDDTSVMLGMTEVLYGLADWQNLLTLYNNIIYHTQDLGEVTQAYVEKGVILDGRMGLTDNAVQHLEKALQLDPNQPAALIRLAEIALRRQDWATAGGLMSRLGAVPSGGMLPVASTLIRAVVAQAGGDTGMARGLYAEARGMESPLAAKLKELSIDAPDRVAELLKTALQGWFR
ncbi:MAG TPA: tetratricopeptide repeat protein, partial [Myxococcota bacterium]|nr:tetratricopeptide repeat protein [Myxococcota bacterium]